MATATHPAQVLDDVRSKQLNEAYLIASGDIGQSANLTCWPTECFLRERLTAEFGQAGCRLLPAHPPEPELGDAFLYNCAVGDGVFQWIPADAPVVVAEAVWHCGRDIVDGLLKHRGPILTLGNWSGEWPGLLGTLNLNGSLRSAGKAFSTLMSDGFEGEAFAGGLQTWLLTRRLAHDESHVREVSRDELPAPAVALGDALARELRTSGAHIAAITDGCEGPMGTALDDALLAGLGIRASRSRADEFLKEMSAVSDTEAIEVRLWLERRGVRFVTGPCEESDLTDGQITQQCRMYIAAVRLCAANAWDAFGIHYDGWLKHAMPAPDLGEGMLNNIDRAPVFDRNGEELLSGRHLTYFNEADECAGVDGLVTDRVWGALGLDPATTLHDIRSARESASSGVMWVLQIAGAVPASHLAGGYAGLVSERQPPLGYPLGGGTMNGTCRPGDLVWSRIFREGGQIHADLGRATATQLPAEELHSIRKAHTAQWPILATTMHGMNAEQFVSRQRSNHVQIAYAPTPEAADHALATKAAMLMGLGVVVHICGV